MVSTSTRGLVGARTFQDWCVLSFSSFMLWLKRAHDWNCVTWQMGSRHYHSLCTWRDAVSFIHRSCDFWWSFSQLNSTTAIHVMQLCFNLYVTRWNDFVFCDQDLSMQTCVNTIFSTDHAQHWVTLRDGPFMYPVVIVKLATVVHCLVVQRLWCGDIVWESLPLT